MTRTVKRQKLKVPPHSIEAEVSVLGAILIDKNAIVEVQIFCDQNVFMSLITA